MPNGRFADAFWSMCFARCYNPNSPFAGDASVVALAAYLYFFRNRGPSASHSTRRDMNVFAEVCGFQRPLSRPAVFSASIYPKTIERPRAPLLPFGFVLSLEKTASDSEQNPGLRLYCALFFLMTMASLRFCKTRDVLRLWPTKTAVCGVSINHKDAGGALMSRATPREGMKSNRRWFRITATHWDKVKPDDG